MFVSERLSRTPQGTWQRFRRPETDSLNVAVVGLGYWGPNLLRALFEIPDVDVRWICDLDNDRLAHYARRYPSARPTPDLDDVLTDPAVDAVVVATPVFTHYALATRCLPHGKHVFGEKPIASSSEEAEELLHLA